MSTGDKKKDVGGTENMLGTGRVQRRGGRPTGSQRNNKKKDAADTQLH